MKCIITQTSSLFIKVTLLEETVFVLVDPKLILVVLTKLQGKKEVFDSFPSSLCSIVY